MLRRLHPDQPESFAFTPANHAWAEAQITKYPEGRQASAVIPLLWRAQEQEGWLSRAAIEHVGEMLQMPFIRVLEVATFYFMFQLQPVGNVAHFQICGTTSCMICGAEDLIDVCKSKIAKAPHEISEDGKFSWEEVECLGACSNAPMAQVGKDYYEDLSAARFAELIDEMADGQVPVPGPQNGRFASEPLMGLTSLTELERDAPQFNASVQRATDLGDTLKRIDGQEIPLTAPWQSGPVHDADVQSADFDGDGILEGAEEGTQPPQLDAPRGGIPDDLKHIKGIGTKLEVLCNSLGFYHFDQIASWSKDEVAWVDANLDGFRGRVSRDRWVEQAKTLAAGGETAFASRVKKGNVY